jgi:hypothetical protein
MSPEESRLTLLRSEIERDWGAIEQRLQRALSVDPARGEAESALVALSLDHAYQAFETLLVRVERALGLPERAGANWHNELLADASLELENVRPSIVSNEAALHWRALLRFRHFLRHAYAVDLDAAELARNRAHFEIAVASTRNRVQQLLDALKPQ